ncbi:hypothetical protein EJ02DRAFT_509331 [Clathrospora elynae]|uniref:Uncharacterized protein n=1 Tax=Clathrospora elynae TaxID=706981 RepID=A0A6A5SZ30_9PLEO|nr:hypothetical protein EJ02DRAFT_509331 [Clathrospora elynae]
MIRRSDEFNPFNKYEDFSMDKPRTIAELSSWGTHRDGDDPEGDKTSPLLRGIYINSTFRNSRMASFFQPGCIINPAFDTDNTDRLGRKWRGDVSMEALQAANLRFKPRIGLHLDEPARRHFCSLISPQQTKTTTYSSLHTIEPQFNPSFLPTCALSMIHDSYEPGCTLGLFSSAIYCAHPQRTYHCFHPRSSCSTAFNHDVPFTVSTHNVPVTASAHDGPVTAFTYDAPVTVFTHNAPVTASTHNVPAILCSHTTHLLQSNLQKRESARYEKTVNEPLHRARR